MHISATAILIVIAQMSDSYERTEFTIVLHSSICVSDRLSCLGAFYRVTYSMYISLHYFSSFIFKYDN